MQLRKQKITVIDTASACGNRNLVLKKWAIGNNNTAKKKASNMGIISFSHIKYIRDSNQTYQWKVSLT
jgi:hypothetical protein